RAIPRGTLQVRARGGLRYCEIRVPSLAVDRHRFDAERLQRFGNCGHAVSPILAMAAEHAHAVAVAPADEPEAVVLDFVGPCRPGWNGVAERRQARLNETGWTTRGRG